MPLPSTELSPEVRALAETFKSAAIGDLVTYDQMSDAISRDVKRVRYLVLRALHVAHRETGAIFATVNRHGYKRLPAEDAHKIGAHARTRVRRTASRAQKVITGALSFANDVPDDARRKASSELSALGLIQILAQDRALPEPASDGAPLPVAVTAKQFLAKIGAT